MFIEVIICNWINSVTVTDFTINFRVYIHTISKQKLLYMAKYNPELESEINLDLTGFTVML